MAEDSIHFHASHSMMKRTSVTLPLYLCLLLVMAAPPSEAKPQFFEAVGDFVENVGEGVGSFFDGVGDFFSGLFGSGRDRSKPVSSPPPVAPPIGPVPGPIPQRPAPPIPQRPLTFEEALNTNNLRVLVDDD